MPPQEMMIIKKQLSGLIAFGRISVIDDLACLIACRFFLHHDGFGFGMIMQHVLPPVMLMQKVHKD